MCGHFELEKNYETLRYVTLSRVMSATLAVSLLGSLCEFCFCFALKVCNFESLKLKTKFVSNAIAPLQQYSADKAKSI